MDMQRGDFVVCIDAHNSDLTLYNRYSIDNVMTETIFITDAPNISYHKSRFYKPRFTKGEEIVCINNTDLPTADGSPQRPSTNLIVGKTYTIIDIDTLVKVQGNTCISHYCTWRFIPVALYKPAEKAPCPDCKGTGIYTGLFAVEVCSTCKGNKS